MAQWPGLRTDRSAPKSPRVAAATDPTYPAKVESQILNPRLRAKAELAAVAERVLSPIEEKNREALANGETAIAHVQAMSSVLRFIPGGRKTVIGIIQRAARNRDATALAWWKIFADLRPVHQARIDLDDVCEAAGVAPDELMAVVVSTQMRLGADAADLAASVFHPMIVKQTAKSALRITGEYVDVAQRDREFMLQHGKFIAAPKGTSVTVNASAQAAAAAQSEPSVPSFSDSVNGALAAHRAITREVIDATVTEVEEP